MQLQWLLDLHIVWNRGKFVQQDMESKNHVAEDLIILKDCTVQSYLNLPKSLCYSKLCSTKQWSSRTYFTLLLWKPIFPPKRVLLVGTILSFIWQTFNFYSKSGIKVNIYLVLFQKYLVLEVQNIFNLKVLRPQQLLHILIFQKEISFNHKNTSS